MSQLRLSFDSWEEDLIQRLKTQGCYHAVYTYHIYEKVRAYKAAIKYSEELSALEKVIETREEDADETDDSSADNEVMAMAFEGDEDVSETGAWPRFDEEDGEELLKRAQIAVKMDKQAYACIVEGLGYIAAEWDEKEPTAHEAYETLKTQYESMSVITLDKST